MVGGSGPASGPAAEKSKAQKSAGTTKNAKKKKRQQQVQDMCTVPLPEAKAPSWRPIGGNAVQLDDPPELEDIKLKKTRAAVGTLRQNHQQVMSAMEELAKQLPSHISAMLYFYKYSDNMRWAAGRPV